MAARMRTCGQWSIRFCAMGFFRQEMRLCSLTSSHVLRLGNMIFRFSRHFDAKRRRWKRPTMPTIWAWTFPNTPRPASAKIIFTALMCQRARAVSQVHSNLSHLIHTKMMCEFTQVAPIQLKRNEELSRGQRPPQRQWCARSRLFANALSTRVEQPYRYIGIYREYEYDLYDYDNVLNYFWKVSLCFPVWAKSEFACIEPLKDHVCKHFRGMIQWYWYNLRVWSTKSFFSSS